MADNELSFQHHADVGFEAKADWQPISKAPRDGREGLVWKAGWDEPRWTLAEDWDGVSDGPTHWYPVPPLPPG